MAAVSATAVWSHCANTRVSSESSPVSSFVCCGPSLRSVRHAAGGGRARRVAGVCVRAAKSPSGVEPPKEQPKLPVSFWGFTENAEVWNSRAAMIGFFGILAVEFFSRKGILELVGIEIGKGLDLPL